MNRAGHRLYTKPRIEPDGAAVNEVQSKLLKMYEDIREVLDRNGIAYYAFFGTALGAVRHNGFIPWDDDMDLAVWIEDIPRINEALSKELDPEKYYYHVPRADDHPHVVLIEGDLEKSIRDKTALFIDLFPLSGFPDRGLRQLATGAAIWGDNIAIYALDRIGPAWLHRSLRWTHRFFSKLADLCAGKDCSLVTVRATHYKEYTYPRDLYGKPVMHVFEDTDIPLPEKWEDILTGLYGDFMVPPPEDKRSGATGFPCSLYKDYLEDQKRS